MKRQYDDNKTEIRKILNEESKSGKGKRIRNRKKMIKRWKFEKKEGIGNVKTEKQKLRINIKVY